MISCPLHQFTAIIQGIACTSKGTPGAALAATLVPTAQNVSANDATNNE